MEINELWTKTKLYMNSKLAGTTMCKFFRASVGSEKSCLDLNVSNSIICSSSGEYTVRNVETQLALVRANTHPTSFTHGCTRKFTIYLQSLLISPHHAKLQTTWTLNPWTYPGCSCCRRWRGRWLTSGWRLNPEMAEIISSIRLTLRQGLDEVGHALSISFSILKMSLFTNKDHC